MRKGIWDPAYPECHLQTDLRRETLVLNPVTVQSFISLFFPFSFVTPPHYSDAYEQNSTDGACFYELSPEIWFEISPVSSVLLSLQQMHLNVSNLFVACATTRAKEGRTRTVIRGEAELPTQHKDP